MTDSSAERRAARLGLPVGPIFALLVFLWLQMHRGDPRQAAAAAVIAWMAVWWLTEAVPLALTSLLPFVLFPLGGVMTADSVAGHYMNSTILLLVGGFLIARAMERHNLHRRVALVIVTRLGTGPRALVLGFMVACGALSMWISNTATAAMMLPIGLAVLNRIDAADQQSGEGLGRALLLGIAYGCSIGGMATLVGTPPNLILRGYIADHPAAGPGFSFAQWFLFGFPLAAILLVCAWLTLTRLFLRAPAALRIDAEEPRAELRALGPMNPDEKSVLVVFIATAILWMSRADIDLGVLRVPGWNNLLPFAALPNGKPTLDDGVVSILMAGTLFLLPARNGGRLLEADVFARLPWSVVLLFGGGFALAAGFEAGGLSTRLSRAFAALEGVPLPLLVLITAVFVTFITELTSNTATINLLLPVLAGLATAVSAPAMLFMLPATLSASAAFMMPAATPPNAIVFASERLRIGEMARAGLILNLVGALIITLFTWLLGPLIFEGMHAGGAP